MSRWGRQLFVYARNELTQRAPSPSVTPGATRLWVDRLRLTKRNLEDVVDVGGEVNCHALQDFAGDVFEVVFVVLGEDDLANSGPVGSQNLLLDTADG